MKFKKQIISAITVFAMILVMAIPALAASRNKQLIYLPENQRWTTAGTLNRDGSSYTVYARCHSVYPLSGSDNFTRIQCRVTNSHGEMICARVYSLTEGTGEISIPIEDGKLTTSVTFQFRGNKKFDASAVVSYRT